MQARLSLGDLLVFSAYLLLLYQPLEQLTYTAWAVEGAAAGAQRCIEVLDHQDDVLQKPDAQSLPSGGGNKIEFINVNFHYLGEAGERPILENINLSIHRGENVAVGGTGAGKSTLLILVPRFYDPAGGGRTHRWDRPSQSYKGFTEGTDRNRLAGHLLFSATVREEHCLWATRSKV